MGILDILIGKRVQGDEKRKNIENIPVKPLPRHQVHVNGIYEKQVKEWEKYNKGR